MITRTLGKLKNTLLLLAPLLLIGLMEQTALADPLFFSHVTAFQNNDTVQVDLFSNPGTTLLGSNLTFSVDVTGAIPMGANDTLQISYLELGASPIVQNFQLPLFGSVNPPFTLIFSIVSPVSNPMGVPATLTIDLLNSSPDFVIPGGSNQGRSVNSNTYSFNVKPVPEPATLLALAGGMSMLGIRIYRRRV